MLQFLYTSAHHNFPVSLNVSFALGSFIFALKYHHKCSYSAFILSRSSSRLEHLFTKWKLSSLSSSAILFAYLTAWRYEVSLFRLLRTKKQTYIIKLYQIILVCYFSFFRLNLTSFASFHQSRFHSSSVLTLTNKNISVAKITLFLFLFWRRNIH